MTSDYFQRVLSPWVPGVDNPFPARLSSLAEQGGLAVDVGCGPGVLVGYLSQLFGRVVAVDRDVTMVEAAGELIETLRGKGAPFGEIDLRHEDWAHCSWVRGAAVVTAVNSLLETDPVKRQALLAMVASALSPGGTFLGVFPAMESQVHLARIFAREQERSGLAPAAVRRAVEEELMVGHSFDPLAGTYGSRGEEAQKFVYELELRFELAHVGLEVISVERIHYPWEVCRHVDAGYYPAEAEIFDWFVVATRS